jgi:hypothetical protein
MKITNSNIKSTIIGLLSKLRINLGGQLYGGEGFSLVLLPFIDFKKLFRQYTILKKILFCYVLMLTGLVLSDINNETIFLDYIRGWLNFVFSFISLIVLLELFSKNTKNLYYYLFFFALSNYLFGAYIGAENLQEDNSNYFKVKFEPFLTPLIILLLTKINQKLGRPAMLFACFCAAVLYVVADARSVGLCFFISFIFLAIKFYKFRLKGANLIFVLITSLSVSYLAYIYYVNKIFEGEITGDNARQITKADNPYNPLQLLFYGRTEAFVSILAIQERPLLGFGSWAKDPYGKYNKLSAKLAKSEYFDENEVDLIPAHSMLVGAWVWGGVLTFIGIFYLFCIFIKLFIRIYKNSNTAQSKNLLIVITPLFANLVWHFLFSPLQHVRISLPQVLAIMVVMSIQLNRKKNNENMFRYDR